MKKVGSYVVILLPSFYLMHNPFFFLSSFRHTNFPLSPEHRSFYSSSQRLVWYTPLLLPNCNLSSRSRKARISSRHASTRLMVLSLIPCRLVLPWAVPQQQPACLVYPHITTTFLVASPLVATRLKMVATTMRRTSERVPNAAVERPPLAMHQLVVRAGPAVVQMPVAATHPRLRTAQHRHYLPPSPFPLMPRDHTLGTLTLRWASDHPQRQPHPCNSPRHPITRMQAQLNSTTQARTAPRVTISMPRNRDSWHRPPLLAMVSANLGSPPHLVNGHMVEQSRVDTHGGEQLYLHCNTHLYTRF
jgi:hypothetical protein